MSFPNIPNITPLISVTTAQTIPLLLSSIALEELALAHIMNAKAEKLQLVLGTLTPTRTTFSPATVSLSNLLAVDASVQRTLRDVIKKEMLLEFKFDNVLDLLATAPPPPPPPPTVTVTLNADPPTICAFGTGSNTSTLTGQVLVNGSPPPAGTMVFFTVSAPNIVALNPALTDAFGNFTAIFTATDGPGPAAVTATALGTSSTPVAISIVDCSVLTSFSFAANPTTVCSLGTGSNTSVLTGQVLVGGGAVAGIPVVFSVAPATLGTVFPIATTTDASGNFSTTFTAIDGPGTAFVTALLPTFGATITIAITIIDCP